jgi:hypothetical protein
MGERGDRVKGYRHITIEGLTIRNMPRSGITMDDQVDEAYRGITIRDCTLRDNGLSGIRLAAVDGFLVQSVEAYGNGYHGLDITGFHDGDLSAANGLVEDSGFHHHTGWEGHGLAIDKGASQVSNISVAPMFVEPAVPDAILQPGSPCIDAGVDVGLPYSGGAPDMGAVEYEPER